MGHPLESGAAEHPPRPAKSDKSSQKKPRSAKRLSKSSRPALRRNTSSKKRIDPRVLSPQLPTPDTRDHDSAMSSNNGTVPRYESSSSDSVHTASSSSRESTGSTASSVGRSHDNCHFAASPELQMVDSLLAMLTQNGARRPNGQSSQR